VLSPSTARLDRTDKLAVYAEYKVGHCWLVDPVALTLEVFELRDERWTLFGTFKDADHTFPLDVLWTDDQPPD